jgi:hypothetical protein
MPETLAFQRMPDVSGAGPAEERENEEPPINWGHSYWSRLELSEADADVCACAAELDCRLKTAETDETSNSARISVTLILTCVNPCPQE